jgi:hypothetical protein
MLPIALYLDGFKVERGEVGCQEVEHELSHSKEVIGIVLLLNQRYNSTIRISM